MKIFWSWQSDTPGKTGRHFVRDAIEAAIATLKAPPDVEEPTEGLDREAIHLDSDRQGVTGSPDLAAIIFAKIDAATVIVADVTPVGRGPARKGKSGEELPGKALMNPNVAIELGYSLSKLAADGGNRLLMICNEHYGNRADLPFDLAHKAGPVFYRLAPDATKSAIEAEGKKLRRELVAALRPFLDGAEAALAPMFVPMLPGTNLGVWFQRGEPLGESGDARFGDVVQHTIEVSPVVYLRLIPTRPLTEDVTRSNLANIARRLPHFSMTGGPIIKGNRWGAVNIDPLASGGPSGAVAQLFLNGELWGVNPQDSPHFQTAPNISAKAGCPASMRPNCLTSGRSRMLGMLGMSS